MKFMNEDFLLRGKTAKKLYHEYAEPLPILDYHCHIPPQEVYEDRRFENISQVWLGGDHYKWRLIRSNGVPEEEITGKADDRLKFQHFAEALPMAIGNPMYHWTHLELKRYFHIDTPLTRDSAEKIWQACNEKLQSPEMSVRRIIRSSNVEMIGTTDEPSDDLKWHRLIRESGFETKVLPSFRPDKAVTPIKSAFPEAIHRLSEVCGFPIRGVQDLQRALAERVAYFCKNGCRAADHGLDQLIYRRATVTELDEIFGKGMEKKAVTLEENAAFQTEMLLFLAEEYTKRGVVMQIHYGAIRNPNSCAFASLGADAGFDCIAGGGNGLDPALLLDALHKKGALPKTILYSLNPHDNEILDALIGSFQGTECAGKIQHGSAWWFSDTKSGMEAQLRSLANLSILGNFIGMLTDSRSFLSYPRHEYFRRILCNFLGELVDAGEYPEDEAQLKTIVEGISYYNAKRYFSLS